MLAPTKAEQAPVARRSQNTTSDFWVVGVHVQTTGLGSSFEGWKKVAGFAPSCENEHLKSQPGEPMCKALGWELLAEMPAPPGSVGGRRMYTRPNSLLWAAFSSKDPGLSYSKALGTPSTDFFCKLCCVQNALQ